MFGFKKRHAEVMKGLQDIHRVLEETLCRLQTIEDLQDLLSEVTKELNETVTENGKRLNTMINELKGAVAMSSASLPQRIEKLPKKRGRPKKDARSSLL